MKLSVTHALFVAGLVCAQEAFETAGPGPYDNASIWQDADQNPVGDKTVPFTLWYSGDDNGNNGPEWQLRVYVAEAQISDSATPNAQQLSQIYAFTWPNGGSLVDAIAQSPSQLNSSTFCVTVVESLFPKGTTDDYNSPNTTNAADGSCQAPLRRRCLEALTSQIMSREPGENGCRLTDFDLGDVQQCEWTFEHAYQASTYNLVGPTIADQAANGTFPIQSGEGFAHITTETYDGSNTTYRDAAVSRLQMVIIESGDILTPLCLRIDDTSDVGTLEGAAASSGVNSWFIGAAALFAAAYLL